MTPVSRRTRLAALLSFAAFAAVAGTAGPAGATVPGTLTQQGRLFDSAGTPITSSVNLTFTLYDAATAGTSLWTETVTVTPDQGYFSVQLGSTTAFPAATFDGSTRYLGLTVGSDPEMSPRETVSSVPYAFHAGSADTAASATTATTASGVAWTGITGFPSTCPAPQFLSGFDASGNAVCTSPQTWSCTTHGNNVTGTSNYAECSSGEIMTGGGCYVGGGVALTGSYPYTCLGTLCIFPINPPYYGDWICNAAASASITAYIRCCHLQ